jgi:hypothetical protein
MKLPVMMNASGIKKIVIDGSIVWERAASNWMWSRHPSAGSMYVQSKSDEKLMKYVKHLIQKQGYTNVWTSGDTLNVRRPEPIIPKSYKVPHVETMEIRDQKVCGTATGNVFAYVNDINHIAKEFAQKVAERETGMKPPGAHPRIKIGDRVCIKTPPNDNNIDCMLGIVEALNSEVVLVRCTKNNTVRRLSISYFEENYMWIEHEGGGE